MKKFKETRDSRYISQNELDNGSFEHDMAYEDLKDLNRRTFADNALLDKAFIIAKNPKYDGYQRCLSSMDYKFFDKKLSATVIKNENISNKELAKELHKPIIRTFNKMKVYSPFMDNIWECRFSGYAINK